MAWRRAGLVLAAVLLVGWVTGAAPPAAPPADGYEADVLLSDGTKLERARVLNPVIRLTFDSGVHELDPRKVRLVELTADDDGPGVTANVSLADKSTLQGPLETASFRVTAGDATTDYPAAKVEQIKYRHPRDLSLAAALIGLLTLTLMEIVLGVDNIVLLSIYVGKLPAEQQRAGRLFGLGGAVATRLMLLATLSYLVGLTRPLFVLPAQPFGFLGGLNARGLSARDLILFFGGLYLLYSSAKEIREKVESHRAAAAAGDGPSPAPRKVSFWGTIVQLAIVDIVFSIDSVITAIGMVDELWVMMAAVLLSVGVMLVAAKPIGDFVNRRPTVKVLALSFLILIGALLVAEGLGQHLDKGYIYFAMVFAVGVELVNARLR